MEHQEFINLGPEELLRQVELAAYLEPVSFVSPNGEMRSYDKWTLTGDEARDRLVSSFIESLEAGAHYNDACMYSVQRCLMSLFTRANARRTEYDGRQKVLGEYAERLRFFI